MNHKLLARFPLSNPRRLWQQDNFVLSNFCPGPLGLERGTEEDDRIMRRAVKTCYDAGFNLLELGWASPSGAKSAVRMAEQLGIGIVYQNLYQFGGMGPKNVFCEKNDLLAAIDEMKNWKSVVGFYLWDEPTTPEQLKAVREMLDLCERERPDALPFTLANPSYNSRFYWKDGNYAPYIDVFIETIDPPVMSFDYYPVGMKEHDRERQLDESLMWCDLEYIRRAAKEKDIPFWFYYQGENLHKEEFYIFPMIRLMMHSALLYGVKGLQQYTAQHCVIDVKDGGHGPFFDDIKNIHKEITELGRTLMALECTHVIHDDALLPDCPYMQGLRTPISESKLLTGKLPYRTSISELTDAYGNDYLMVVNRDYLESKDITLEFKDGMRVYEVSREDGEQRVVADNTRSFTASFIEGGMALYRVEPAKNDPATIEYYLEKDRVPATKISPREDPGYTLPYYK